MTSMPGTCSECREPWAAVSLDERVICDRCADRRLAEITGWPTLVAPPPLEAIVGPDGRRHILRYRVMRMPAAITALVEEIGCPPDAGYRLDLSIDHQDDPGPLLQRARQAARSAIGDPFLEPDEWHGRELAHHEAAGRLTEGDEPDDLPRVVIDGHMLN